MKFLASETFKSQDWALLILALTIPGTIFLLAMARIFGSSPLPPEGINAMENVMSVIIGAVSARLVGPAAAKNGENSNGKPVEPSKA